MRLWNTLIALSLLSATIIRDTHSHTDTLRTCLAAQAHGVTAGAWVCGRDVQADAQPHLRTGQAQGPHGRAVVRRVKVWATQCMEAAFLGRRLCQGQAMWGERGLPEIQGGTKCMRTCLRCCCCCHHHHCRVDQINDTLLKISGLDDQMDLDGTGRED